MLVYAQTVPFLRIGGTAEKLKLRNFPNLRCRQLTSPRLTQMQQMDMVTDSTLPPPIQHGRPGGRW
jgi:hypothetical protein